MELERAQELHSRFTHLLQPIRDLTKNWDVDVASQLEEYLEEIESVTITFNEGATKMNFAEAALLIQGSTCVYSKKVEYLYALVYQTLDLIASKRKLAQASSMDTEGRDNDISFAQKKDQEEFLILDDMTEATNIDMVEGRKEKSSKTPSTIPRTPASLIPIMDSERATSTPLLSCNGELLGSKLDFKMNTSLLHPSGALLLEPMGQVVIEVRMTNSKKPIPITYDTPAEKIKALLTPGTASNAPEDVADNADSAFPAEGMANDDLGCYSDDDMGPTDGLSHSFASPAKKSATEDGGLRRSKRVRLKEEAKMEDPWKFLDPHDPITTSDSNRPFKKGTTHRLLPSLKKSTTRKRKKSVISPSESLSQFLLKSFYCCSSMFPKNHLKAPMSSEFEGLYWAEQRSRAQQKRRDNAVLSRLHKESAVSLEQQAKEEEAEEEEGAADYQPLAPDDDYSDDEQGDMAAAPFDGGYDFDAVETHFEGVFQQAGDHQMDVGGAWGNNDPYQGVEPMAIDDCKGASSGGVAQNYEDLVRNYVECTMAGVLTYAQETALSKRVREWEEKIKPRLVREEHHPAFDIHMYGAHVIEEFQKRNCGPNEGRLHFQDLMQSKRPFEISRTFAATLQLANDYNVGISSEGTGEKAVNTMGLTLLSSQLAHKAVSDYRAPSLNHDTAKI